MLPLFLQTLLGYPALQSGLAVSPRGLGALTASIVVGRLIGRVDSRVLVAAGFSVLAGSAAGLQPHEPRHRAAERRLDERRERLRGAADVRAADHDRHGHADASSRWGRATGIFNLMRNIGASVGIASGHDAADARHAGASGDAWSRTSPRTTRSTSAGWRAPARASLRRWARPPPAPPHSASCIARWCGRRRCSPFLDTFRLLSFLAMICVPLVLLFRRVRARPTPVVVD